MIDRLKAKKRALAEEIENYKDKIDTLEELKDRAEAKAAVIDELIEEETEEEETGECASNSETETQADNYNSVNI